MLLKKPRVGVHRGVRVCLTLSCINIGFLVESFRCNQEHSLKAKNRSAVPEITFGYQNFFRDRAELFLRHRSACFASPLHRSWCRSLLSYRRHSSHLRVLTLLGGPGPQVWTSFFPSAARRAPAGHNSARGFKLSICNWNHRALACQMRACGGAVFPNSGLRHGTARTWPDVLTVSRSGLDSFDSGCFQLIFRRSRFSMGSLRLRRRCRRPPHTAFFAA